MMLPVVHHRVVEVAGLRIFYREAGPADAPVLLLLHGFPSSSFQYRRLIDALGGRFRVIAPDYPGFGHSAAPPVTEHLYTFDTLADAMERFCEALSLTRFVVYLFDFGAPVGLRLAERHPDWIAGLVVQNGNAHVESLSPMARDFVALQPGVPGAEATARSILTADATRSQYLTGARDPERISPDAWTTDQHFLDLPGRADIQVALALDYHTNVAAYPRWQAWLRAHRPPALVLWGRGDPFFLEAGAQAWHSDLPDATVHVFDTGHFALEEDADEIAPLVADFMHRVA